MWMPSLIDRLAAAHTIIVRDCCVVVRGHDYFGCVFGAPKMHTWSVYRCPHAVTVTVHTVDGLMCASQSYVRLERWYIGTKNSYEQQTLSCSKLTGFIFSYSSQTNILTWQHAEHRAVSVYLIHQQINSSRQQDSQNSNLNDNFFSIAQSINSTRKRRWQHAGNFWRHSNSTAWAWTQSYRSKIYCTISRQPPHWFWARQSSFREKEIAKNWRNRNFCNESNSILRINGVCVCYIFEFTQDSIHSIEYGGLFETLFTAYEHREYSLTVSPSIVWSRLTRPRRTTPYVIRTR